VAPSRPSGLALAILFALGAVCGMAAGSGSMTLLVLPAALCCCTPWTRLRAHQLHLFLSFLAAAALLCIGLCGEELLRKKGGSRRAREDPRRAPLIIRSLFDP